MPAPRWRQDHLKRFRWFVLWVGSVAMSVGAASPSFAYEVLVFSKTAGFRHGNQITAGQQAITQLGSSNGFTATFTEDAAAFTGANLATYEAVVFLNTSGDVLTDALELYAQENGMADPSICTFRDAGFLTMNKGILVRMGGAEFELTIVRRR